MTLSNAAQCEPDTVIVVPTYNERENLPLLAQGVRAALPKAMLLIVDDNSPDGTGTLARELAAAYPENVAVHHRQCKEGLGAAYVDGLREALRLWPAARHIIQMDADLSHRPEYLPALLDATAEADVVVGSRYVQGISIVNWPLHRLIVSKAGTAAARLLTGLPLTDCTSGFKCYRAAVLRDLELETIRSNGYVFQIETSYRAWRKGYHVQDIPIIFHERHAGQSKLDLSIAFETFCVLLRLAFESTFSRRRQPIKHRDTGAPRS